MLNIALNLGSTNEQKIGVPPEQLAELIRQHANHSDTQLKLIVRLEAALEINENQMRAALAILGEANVATDRLGPKLVEIAERFRAASSLSLSEDRDDPKITSLKIEAEEALRTGDVAKADAVLADVELEQSAMLDRLSVEAAKTCAGRGEIALVRLRYKEAAMHFSNAARKVEPGGINEPIRVGYMQQEALALYHHGSEQGDNAALLSGIELVEPLVRRGPGSLGRSDWVTCQNILGVTLCALGERENASVRLVESAAVLRTALAEVDRARDPLQWAVLQNNLGAVLVLLGERETGTARLVEGVAALRASLREKSREPGTYKWTNARANLGGALFTLGEREGSISHLTEAIKTLRTALKECDRESTPLGWALIQNTLGNALWSLGRLQRSAVHLKQAVATLRGALQERTRERVPLQWATTQNNLGNALQSLAALKPGTAKLEDALAAYHAALQERTRNRAPMRWAETMNNIGFALLQLGTRETGSARFEEAIAAFRAALEVRTRTSLPHQWEETRNNLILAEQLLSKRREQYKTGRWPTT